MYDDTRSGPFPTRHGQIRLATVTAGETLQGVDDDYLKKFKEDYNISNIMYKLQSS